VKRSAPLARRTRLRSKTRLRARSRTNSYQRRPRDLEHMQFVRSLPCIVRTWREVIIHGRALGRAATALGWYQELDRTPAAAVNVLDQFCDKLMTLPSPTTCEGHVQADHAGRRGIGQKSADDTCAPMCRKHHEERTDVKQTFRGFTKIEMRAWCDWAIEQARADVAQLKAVL